MAAPALLFDLDGTIWDSRTWYAELASSHGSHSPTECRARLDRGYPAARLLRECGVSERRYALLCRDDRPDLYPAVADTLTKLTARGTPLAAVTNLPQWMAAPALTATGLVETFTTLVSYGRTSRKKPHPDPLLAALTDMHMPADPTIFYVGDDVGDAKAAAAAGLAFAWANWGYGAEPNIPHTPLDRFSQVADL